MTTPDKIDRVLGALRSDIAALEIRLRDATTRSQRGSVCCALAAALIALTAAPWESLDRTGRNSSHLWQLAGDRAFAVVALLLILALGVSSFVLTAGRVYHGVLAALGVLTAISVLFAGAGADEGYSAAAGRVLAFFVTAGLISVHAAWAGDTSSESAAAR
jgi:hypothetical protein